MIPLFAGFFVCIGKPIFEDVFPIMIKYRNATINDLPAIVDIYNSTVAGRMVTADTSPVPVEEKINWFNAHDPVTRPLWLAEENEALIGWASFNNFYGRPAYSGTAELSIYLHEDYRGKGYGPKILDHCIAAAPSLQIHTLLAFIFSHNNRSIRLFESRGFTKWAHLPNVAVMDGNRYSLEIFGLPFQA
jgi:L-amino acid N-acyltransferase YncA